MGFLSWLGGIVVAVWLILFLLRIGGALIHWLLIIAVVVFIWDVITGKKGRKKT